MGTKTGILIGVGIGYVLGTRAGRERHGGSDSRGGEGEGLVSCHAGHFRVGTGRRSVDTRRIYRRAYFDACGFPPSKTT